MIYALKPHRSADIRYQYLILLLPKIFEQNGYKFFFYSGDGDEPCHIHVKKGKGDGKIWLEPKLKIEYFVDFKNQEEAKIIKIATENRDNFIKMWYEYFKDKY